MPAAAGGPAETGARGRRSRSSTRPDSTMRPWSRRETESAICSTVSISWVMKRIDRSRSSRSSLSSATIEAVAVGVEARGRLVREEHGRSQRQGPRDPHALALAAGQLVRVVPGPVGESDTVEELADPAWDSAAVTPRYSSGNATSRPRFGG